MSGFNEMLMARARRNHLAAAGITPIGSKATAQNLTFSSGPSSSNAVCALPSGCAAGDDVVLSCNGQLVGGFSWSAPTGTTTTVVASTALGSVARYAVYVYTLTQSDVDAGTVSVPCGVTTSGSWTVGSSVVVDAYRNVSGTPLDVIGTIATGTFSGSTQTITAPGFTTLLDGDLLQYTAIGNLNSTYTSQTPPAGWTIGDKPDMVYQAPVATGYLPQTTHGATGDVGVSFTAGVGGLSGPYAIVLLSLRKKSAAINLSATFPASPHVGDVVSFDVTATLVDGATGTPTITVDQLPAGLSLGSTSMVDATHYKATVSGTLTTVQDITCTFSTTGGSPNATPLAHEFNVTVASSTITQVGAPVIFTATSGNLPLPTGCQAGDVLVIANRGASMPAPSGFTTLLAPTAIGTSGRKSAIYAKPLTATDISNGHIAVSNNSNTCTATAWRSVDNTTLTNAIGTLGTGPAVSGDVVMVAPGITTTVDGCLILFFGMPDVNSSTTGTFTPPTGYSDVADNFTTLRAHTIDSLLQTTHGATGDVTGTYVVSGTWPWGAILIALKPA